jgi:putative membrane protein
VESGGLHQRQKKNQTYMKRTLLSAALIVGLLLNSGCSSNRDSKETAKDINENRIENGAAETTASDSKSDSKDVADYMVDLANTGMTEYELSKVAAEKAVTPTVKQYAREAVEQHAKDESALRAEAGKYSIVLPTTLSNDSQDMLTRLRDEKVGTDFDKKFLDNMADINDKAISKAKKLNENTTQQELRTFVQKIIMDDQAHLDKAKAIKGMIK